MRRFGTLQKILGLMLLLGFGASALAQEALDDALFGDAEPSPPNPSQAPELTRTPDLLGALLRLAGGFGILLLIMGGILKLLRRWTTPLQQGEPPVSLLYEQPLGQRRSICFVRVGEQVLVLGVTSSQISYLTRVEDPALLESLHTPVTPRTSLGQSWNHIRQRLGLF